MSEPSKPKREPVVDDLLRTSGVARYGATEDDVDLKVTNIIMVVGCLVALVSVLALGWWIIGLVSANSGGLN